MNASNRQHLRVWPNTTSGWRIFAETSMVALRFYLRLHLRLFLKATDRFVEKYERLVQRSAANL